jgi:5-oxopent-3-ene-1,2,5-tricarboxylate decarboxylase/2-hydroxyhepta-2,4-diene-1,7-dioate isomerase
MQPGDVVEVEVTGVGRLSNTVAECPAPTHAVGHQPRHDTDGILRVALGGDWWAARDAEKAAAAAATPAGAVSSS